MRQSISRDCLVFPFVVALASIAVSTTLLEAQVTPQVRVAPTSLEILPAADNKKGIQVNLRWMDPSIVTDAISRFQTITGEATAPASWTAFDATIPPGNCAWLIVVDSSNPARQRTVEACASEVRTFLQQRPQSDSVMIATLSRDLVVLAPFNATSTQLEAALDGMKAEGDTSFTTLIFQNSKQALTDHLVGRPEARKCVVLLTDGKDETPGGPLRVTESRNEFITAATSHGIPIHTLGFAEKANEGNYFADLKELSARTDGIHASATVATRQLPPRTWDRLIGVMHSGGTAVLDLPEGGWQGHVKLELKCGDGRMALVEIPHDALPAVSSDLAAPAAQGEPDSMLPSWLAWTVGGLALLVLLSMKRQRSNRADDKNKRAQKTVVAPVAGPLPSDNPPRVALAFLDQMEGDAERYPVTAEGVTIELSTSLNVIVRHSSVQKGHYSLILGDEGWVIADTGSANGLRVNGTYYHQATLNHGDVIDMGGVRMRFVKA